MAYYSISKLPKAGLGNKLFSWASGLIFAKKNNREHIIIGMTKLHPMAFLRNDYSNRFYYGYFKNERLFSPFQLKKSIFLTQAESAKILNINRDVIFNEIPHWSDMFHTLKDYRELIKKEFWNTMSTKVYKKVNNHKPPKIGLHIRMGDFRKLEPGEDFAKVGSVRTPMSYFIDVVNLIREHIGFDAEVTVFSDGTDEDLKEVLSLKNVSRAANDLDIVHLALLSKSQLIIMSAGSTFSFWAGFLSEAILINHFQHQHGKIRDESTNRKVFEGVLDPSQKELSVNLIDSLNRIKSKLN